MADSSANQDVYALSVCSMNPSLKPGSSKANQSKTPGREIDPNVYIGIRRSPRFIRYQKTSLDSFSSSLTEEKWQVFSVVELNGCAKSYATDVHGLSEYDVLQAHSRFCSKSSHQEKQRWLFDYFATHCPLTNCKIVKGQ